MASNPAIASLLQSWRPVGRVAELGSLAALDNFMHDKNRVVAGIAWYRPEQWTLMLSLIPDPQVFPHTYEEWLARASATFRELSKQGVVVQKVDVDLKALLAWAAEQGRVPDGAVRAEYAQYLTGEADDDTSS